MHALGFIVTPSIRWNFIVANGNPPLYRLHLKRKSSANDIHSWNFPVHVNDASLFCISVENALMVACDVGGESGAGNGRFIIGNGGVGIVVCVVVGTNVTVIGAEGAKVSTLTLLVQVVCMLLLLNLLQQIAAVVRVQQLLLSKVVG